MIIHGLISISPYIERDKVRLSRERERDRVRNRETEREREDIN